MRTRISNARIVLPERELLQSDLVITAETISSIDFAFVVAVLDRKSDADEIVLDFAGDIVIPGLIDLHVHGSKGADTMDGTVQAFSKICIALITQGTVAYLPTTMTASPERLTEIIKAGAQISPADNQAEILGFHLEGPYISEHYLGAQKKQEGTDSRIPLCELVKIVTLAPELSQATELIQRAQSAGITVSAGHTGASYEQMLTYIELGVRHLTHAFNAMPGIHHRTPGLLTAALLDERVSIELIADGVHIHPAVLELALRLKGPDRVILVSDGTRAVGMPDGEYDLGGRQVCLRQGRMTLPDGTIAGSAATLLDGVRFMTQVVGRPLSEAIRMGCAESRQTARRAQAAGEP